ncbi:hypothetical protein [Sphaerisporangium sp. NPDC051011]|uniref:hypothetical protein n=1 Tax=Sphaerisporangium sp. NPDC051011 TaxID=3155792 RepID=UPI0033CB0318
MTDKTGFEIPAADGNPSATQFYSPGSVYAITPTTPETALAVARLSRPAPVSRWEVAALTAPPPPGDDDQDDEDDEDDHV